MIKDYVYSIIATKLVNNRVKHNPTGFGSVLVAFVLGMSILTPILASKYDVDYMPVKEQELVAVGDDTSKGLGEPYIYVPPHGMGTFGKNVINVPYYRNWLNNTIVWKVEKSTDNSKWVSYGKFTVKKDWNEKDLTEKHTVIVDADEEAYYRILTNTNVDNTLVSYDDMSAKEDISNRTNDYTLTFKITDTKSYTLVYNWDDYLKSDTAGISTFSKSIKTEPTSNKQYFEWSMLSTVKIKKDEQFVLDPVYGTIADSVTDNWIYSTEGRSESNQGTIRLGTSEYYVTVSAGENGTDNDGFIRVFKVWNSNGSIKKSLVDKWEYDTSDGGYAGIVNVGTDVYAIIQNKASTYGAIKTVKIWSSNGTIKRSIIDSETTAHITSYDFPQIINVINDIYAVVYLETNYYDTWLETYQISSTGVITNNELDVQSIIMGAGVNYNAWSCVMVDSDTILIQYQDYADWDYWFATYNISSGGIITNTPSDSWEFYTAGTSSADKPYGQLKKIANNYFAFTYADTSQDGWVSTFQVDDAGNIVNNAFIDNLEFADANTITFTNIFTVNDASAMVGGNGVYGITFKDSAGDGWIYTVNITSVGDIGATVNDKLEFDGTDNIGCSPIVYVSGNYYFGVYTFTTNQGKCFSVQIETYTVGAWSNTCPTATGEHPTNSTTGITLQPAVGGTVNDADTNHTLNVTFATNRSGSWVNKQTNNSVARGGKVNWTMTMANSELTKYWWRMYVHDGFCNQTYTYSFTTKANGTWQSIDSGFNGQFKNTTVWFPIDTGFNGQFKNTTVWSAIDSTFNGQFYNLSQWRSIDSTFNGQFKNTTVWYAIDSAFNGQFKNTTVWKSIDTGFNGQFYNLSQWRNIDTGFNGQFTNTSQWRSIDSGFNGQFKNTTIWFVLDSGFNGQFKNTTVWKSIDTGFNGSFYNTSIPESWKIIDQTFNGQFKNTTVWFPIDTGFNGQFKNTTYWSILDSGFNGQFYNLTQWRNIDTGFNGIFNNYTVWVAIDSTFNGQFYNYTEETWKLVDSQFNGQFKNTTVWFSIDSGFNGVFTNTSVWKAIDSTFNGQFYNLSQWRIIDQTFNGVFTNTSTWKPIDTGFNGIFRNYTYWVILDSGFNGVFTNTTTWHDIDTGFDGTFYSSSTWQPIDSDFNGQFKNGTGMGKIYIINVYPVNNTNITNLQPIIYFTINSTYDYVNYTIYIGDSLGNMTTVLYSANNVTVGTFNYPYLLATAFNTSYYFKIVAEYNNNTDVEVIHFRTKQQTNGAVISVNNNMIWGIIGLIGIFGLVGFLLRKKIKDKKE